MVLRKIWVTNLLIFSILGLLNGTENLTNTDYIPSKNQEVKIFVDEYSENKASLFIRGWAMPDSPKAGDKAVVILRKKNIIYRFEVSKMQRDDVQKAYGLSFSEVGYRATVDKTIVKPNGKYNVFVGIERDGKLLGYWGTGKNTKIKNHGAIFKAFASKLKYLLFVFIVGVAVTLLIFLIYRLRFKITSITLSIKNTLVSIIREAGYKVIIPTLGILIFVLYALVYTVITAPKDSMLSLRYLTKNPKPIIVSLDTYSEEKDNLRVAGWAFVKDEVQESNKTVILLISKKGVYRFASSVILRPDVASVYALPTEKVGYDCLIPKGEIVKSGNYSIVVGVERDGKLIGYTGEEKKVSIQKESHFIKILPNIIETSIIAIVVVVTILLVYKFALLCYYLRVKILNWVKSYFFKVVMFFIGFIKVLKTISKTVLKVISNFVRKQKVIKSFFVFFSLILCGTLLFLTIKLSSPVDTSLNRKYLTTATAQMLLSADAYEEIGTLIKIGGWAFLQGGTSEEDKIVVLLKSKDRIYRFYTEVFPREDVKNAFGLLHHRVGYNVLVNTDSIRKKGEYEIFLGIERDTNLLSYSTLSRKITILPRDIIRAFITEWNFSYIGFLLSIISLAVILVRFVLRDNRNVYSLFYYLTALILAAIITMVLYEKLSVSSRFSRPYCEIEIKAPRFTRGQIFYDTGNGFRNADSDLFINVNGKSFVKYRFLIPDRQVFSVRIDPMECDGEFAIRSFEISTSGFFNRWEGKNLIQKVNGINNVSVNSESKNIFSGNSLNNDPMVILWNINSINQKAEMIDNERRDIFLKKIVFSVLLWVLVYCFLVFITALFNEKNAPNLSRRLSKVLEMLYTLWREKIADRYESIKLPAKVAKCLIAVRKTFLKFTYRLPTWEKAALIFTPVKSFMILAVIFGGIVAIWGDKFPVPNRVSHSRRAYEISEGNIKKYGSHSYPTNFVKYMTSFTGIKEKNNLNATNLTDLLSRKKSFYERLCMSNGETPGKILAYIPHSIGMAIGRQLGLSIAGIILMGRILSLVFYIIIISAVIKIAPFHKRLISAIALMPSLLTIAVSSHYDTMLIYASFFLYTGILRLVDNRDERFDFKKVLFIFLCSLIIWETKLIYIPIVALIVFIPASRSKSFSKHAFLVVLAFAFVLLAKIVAAKISDYIYSDLNSPYQAYNQAYISHGRYIIESNITILKNDIIFFLKPVSNSISRLTHSYSVQIIGTILYPLYFVFLLALSVFSSPKRLIPILRITSVGIASLITLAAFAAMYVYDNPVGRNFIGSFDARYILPILPMFMLIFSSRTLSLPKRNSGVFAVIYVIIQSAFLVFHIFFETTDIYSIISMGWRL